MKGVCFEAIGQVAMRRLDEPVLLEPSDAIVEVRQAGLCGSDLHAFWGRETGLDPGTVMGHELVGRVVETGEQVRDLRPGDRVCAPFTTNCGQCFYCQRNMSARCTRGQLFGWRSNGRGLHGCQAERVRVPLAGGTLMKIDDDMPNEVALLVGDNLSTGFYCAELAEVGPDGAHVVIGCGTVGLLCIMSCIRRGARLLSAYDPNEARLGLAEQFGATTFRDPDALTEHVLSVTDGRGADSVMELVGMPDAQQLAIRLIRPGGVMSVIGCHCSPHFAFSPTEAYDKNLTYRTGRCPARSLMPIVAKQFRDVFNLLQSLITHRFTLDQASQAYDVFANRKDGCIKAVFDCDQ